MAFFTTLQRKMIHKMLLSLIFLIFALQPSAVQAAVDFIAIQGSPLTINVAIDGSYQVIHDGVDPSTPGQVFPSGLQEGDAGLFVWYEDVAIGPDFDHHTGSASNTYSIWKNVAQSPINGTGTSADPWRVTTDLRNSKTDVTLSGETRYVNGDAFFTVEWEVCVPRPGDISTFIAADLYLQGSDKGIGYYDPLSGGIGGQNATGDWYEVFYPVTPADHYVETFFGKVWDDIGSDGTPGADFPDIFGAPGDLRDNGAGLQWVTSIDDCATFSTVWAFDAVPPVLPPVLQVSPRRLVFKTVEGGDPPAPQTITIHNGGSLSGSALDWSLTEAADWLTCDTTSGLNLPPGQSVSVTCQTDPAILKPSDTAYKAPITVSSSTVGVIGSPQTVEGRLRIDPVLVTPTPNPTPAVVTLPFDPVISKLGFLSNIPGSNAQVRWAITIGNPSTGAGYNVIVQDTIPTGLRIDTVETTRGTAAVTGQLVIVTIPQLNAGETVIVTVLTTMLQSRAYENTACLHADNLSGERCATASTVSSLPATGEKLRG